jgi:hypothetical protein
MLHGQVRVLSVQSSLVPRAASDILKDVLRLEKDTLGLQTILAREEQDLQDTHAKLSKASALLDEVTALSRQGNGKISKSVSKQPFDKELATLLSEFDKPQNWAQMERKADKLLSDLQTAKAELKEEHAQSQKARKAVTQASSKVHEVRHWSGRRRSVSANWRTASSKYDSAEAAYNAGDFATAILLANAATTSADRAIQDAEREVRQVIQAEDDSRSRSSSSSSDSSWSSDSGSSSSSFSSDSGSSDGGW